MQDKVDEVDPPPSTLKTKFLIGAWSKIGSDVLENLYKSKSGCFQTILDSKGAYAIK